MQIERKKFTEEGYNILSNVVPPNQLESWRHNIEHMVNQRKEIVTQQRTPMNRREVHGRRSVPNLDCNSM